MDEIFYGPRLLTEENILGSSLSGRKPAVLKNPELKFCLKCRGDSCKCLKTTAQLVKRYINFSFFVMLEYLVYNGMNGLLRIK